MPTSTRAARRPRPTAFAVAVTIASAGGGAGVGCAPLAASPATDPQPAAVAATDTAAADAAMVEHRIRTLLERYAADDPPGVAALLDPGGFVLYGSDLGERVDSLPALARLMDADFRLWRSARFGPVQDLSLFVDGDVAAATFHVPFSAGGQPPVMVRFGMAWHRMAGVWRLKQSANTVPTVGQSAAVLARP